jgi:hypothetical protein
MAWTQEQKTNIRRAKGWIMDELDFIRNSLFAPYFMNGLWDKMYISGGCIATLLQSKIPEDMDIYFTTTDTQEEMVKLLLNGLKDKIADVNPAYREVLGKDGKLITENAITMQKQFGREYSVQFITKHNGPPEVIRQTFDFKHCLPYYSFADDKLYISEHQYDLCVNKILETNNQNKVSASRIVKFTKRGYDATGVSPNVASSLQILQDALADIEDV